MSARFASSLLGSARAASRPCVTAGRSAARATRHARSVQSTAGTSRTGAQHPRYVALGIAAAIVATSTYLGRVHLEDESAKGKGKKNRTVATGTEQASGQKLIKYEEVQRHTSPDDCWVIIDGKVYDVTEFLENHPGGAEIILSHAGKDATRIFKPLHPPDALDTLSPEAHLGPVDPLTMPAESEAEETEEDRRIAEWRAKMPDVSGMLLIDDFELWAERVLGGTGWNYYRSAADREITMQENEDAFRRYYLRPRILRNVTNGDLSTEFMGIQSSLPIFISPAAMAKLGHPLGEVNLTKGAGEAGIVQGISINASCGLDEIMAARKDGQKVIFQIYLNKDRKASEALLEKVTNYGAAAVMFTVDAAYRSKRTRDVRAKSHVAAPIKTTSASEAPSKAPLGVSAAISGYQDTNLTWDDIKFIRKHTPLPIIVKGVQSLEDVQMCVDAGVEGVILSNHGGRQCDYAPAPIDILYEIRALRPDLFSKIEIMIDGGIRSGADVVKALALGAKAVGLGRPFLYANGTHGQEGVERVCQIMAEEITNTMRNCGATTISELKPEMVGPRGAWVGENRPNWAPKP